MNNVNTIELIQDYTINNFGIEGLCKKYKIGKLKVKSILQTNGVELKKKGKQPLDKNDFVVKDFHIKKYNEEEGFYYIAVDKNNGTQYNDYMNEGGCLTTHIKEKYNIEIPTLYDRRLYYMKTGNYWWEQWFDIVKMKKKDVIKCPYCQWESIDIRNKSGAYTTHILSHNITIKEHLLKYPNDEIYFKKQVKIIEKENIMHDEKNYVICPICNKKMSKITYSHLRNNHNMGMKEFKKTYPYVNIMSECMIEQIQEEQKKSNLVVSKKRFISKYEREIQGFLNDNNIDFAPNRQILIGKEIDILIESKHLGIEFDVLKWHTEWFGRKDRNYHCNKTNRCNENGYGLIHIFEDEYVNKKEIVFNKLKHILKLNYNLPKIGGRKIVVKEIYKYDAQMFLEQYHIQGFVSSTVYLGGFYGEELVAVMTFKHGNVTNPNWELTRFATKSSYYYQGVASKIFKYFVKNYNPNFIVSFADRRWTPWQDNNLYVKLGFELEAINKPDYKYYNPQVDRYKRVHKMAFNKKSLNKKYGFPMTMTETEMAKELGYDRIWDCGLFKFVWYKKED